MPKHTHAHVPLCKYRISVNEYRNQMIYSDFHKYIWRYPIKHQLYGHLPPITKTIKVRRTRHAGHCWRSRDMLISDVLQWTPTYDRAKAGRPTRTYILQLCEDTGCRPEDLPEAMNDREKWRERVRDIRASGTTSWWWWWYIYIYIYTMVRKKERVIYNLMPTSSYLNLKMKIYR